MLRKITIKYESSTINFKKELLSSIKDVGDFYNSIKPAIIYDKCKLIKNDI